MAYKPIDRSLPPEYLKKQHEAIVWLREQGMRPEDIRVMGWGAVDMTSRMVTIRRRIGPIVWESKVKIKGLPVEHYFMKSRIYSTWMFLKEVPRSWRREKAYDSLYTLAEIGEISVEKQLTFMVKCDNIRVAKYADI